MATPETEISLRNEEINEILSKKPPLMVRKGNVILLTALFCTLIIAYTVHVPETASGTAIITALTGPSADKQAPAIADMYVAQKDLAHIAMGQTVSLSLEPYPSTQQGKIRGMVVTISDTAYKEDNYAYRIQVRLPVITNSALQYRIGMKGVGEVRIGQRSLISYLFR